MTKKVTHLYNKNKEYLITPSLLNAWGYLWYCEKNIKESEKDTICIEDKIELKRKMVYEDFIRTLKREKSEPNQYMLEGIRYEDECYKGNTDISPIIKNGAFQIVGVKHKTINNIKFVLYGRLDVLKGGIIYDIKRVVRYSPQKYINSYQHPFYLELFKKAKQFTYLVFDGKKVHKETYYRDECVNIDNVIENFIEFLKNNNLLDLYFEKWQSKY